MDEPDVTALREIADAYRAALAAADAARAAVEQARAEVNRLQRERRVRLAEVVGDGSDPERMRAAALALGVTTPRVYQLMRNYQGTVVVSDG